MNGAPQTVKKSPFLLHTHHEEVNTGEEHSDLDEVPEGAYMHQTHVDEPCTESTESQDKPLVAEGFNATTIKEKEAETTPVPPSENEVDLEEGSGMCLAIKRDHQVQKVNLRDHTPKSVHEIIEGLEEKASNLDMDTQNMSLQCAHQVMNEVNEVQTRSQENQADDHPSSPIDFPSPWLDDTSSMGTRRESLRSSSPMPVPSSPFTSDPTPPSSLPSSPLIDGATDVTVPLVAQDKLTQPNELHSGDDDHPSTVDIPVVAVLGTRLEQECKEQTIRSALPNPRRPTAISQRKQHEKLSRPFRPPALVTSKRDPKDNVNKDEAQNNAISQYTTPPRRVLKSSPVNEAQDRSKHKTLGTAIQFKSPLISRDGLEVDSSVRLTPTIQMLERKLQILKRAIKVKEDNQEDLLRGLITKWTEAGREIAWEVWEMVKNSADGGQNDFSGIGGKRMYKEGWGWEMGSDKRFKEGEDRKPHSENVNNGMEDSDSTERVDLMKGIDEDEDLDRPHDTLGTMLRQLGIDPQTLGWNDEEEAFQEVTEGIC
ncbi:hypothetical protein Agabi119p4_4748 [Agaricus bisporus var. burnettii]|uniref:Uncharacterized protein n=1 Tax=Agaricus bisporus var. burnettii TaxID=192524 RepID=A0A8H7KHL2_AGABI|nr:hypothetical protein Agabi119p4_4748 [Agaricus bisporus var. burnettii]